MPLPPVPPYPSAQEKEEISISEWQNFEDVYSSLFKVYLQLPNDHFGTDSESLSSIIIFLKSYVSISSRRSKGSGHSLSRRLRQQLFLLTHRLLNLSEGPPDALLDPNFLGDFCTVYCKVPVLPMEIDSLWARMDLDTRPEWIEYRIQLINTLENINKGPRTARDELIRRTAAVLRCSHRLGKFLMIGSDFLDAIVQSSRILDFSIQAKITTVAFLCLTSLISDENKSVSLLVDHLYILRADAEKNGISKSLLANLISTSPFLRKVRSKFENSESGRAKSMLEYLDSFKIVMHGHTSSHNSGINRGKHADRSGSGIHIHKVSLVTQIQDLFPELGSKFIARLLDEYHDDVEQVIAHLLDGSLPSRLREADRSEDIDTHIPRNIELVPDLVPSVTPPMTSQRRNVFDNDELDRLVLTTGKLHIGRRESYTTASIPNKASILAALAAIDPDDDERDDTYDSVEGATDTTVPPEGDEAFDSSFDEHAEDILFSAWKSGLEVFRRDAGTRRSPARADLRLKTGLTDEAIEGWAIMVGRSPKTLQRLEAKHSMFSREQQELESTAWRAGQGSDREGAQLAGRTWRRGRGGRRFKGNRGADGGRGDVAGPSSDRSTLGARQQKERGSRGNNRKNQRSRKIARAGFAT